MKEDRIQPFLLQTDHEQGLGRRTVDRRVGIVYKEGWTKSNGPGVK